MGNEQKYSNEEYSDPLQQCSVIRCFFLLSESKPHKTGNYEVITSTGGVVECRYENFLGNHIWETNETDNLDEKIIAWRFLK